MNAECGMMSDLTEDSTPLIVHHSSFRIPHLLSSCPSCPPPLNFLPAAKPGTELRAPPARAKVSARMSERARLLVIVNHAAARARRAWPGVRAYLEGGQIRFDAHESVRPGETEERTRAALLEGYSTVAVVGGDGTLSAAAAGYFEPCAGLAADERPRGVNPSAALAVLPAGTGDDFARGLTGGRRESLEAWLTRLVEHCRGSDEGAAEADDVPDAGLADESAAVSLQPNARGRSKTTRSVDVLLGSVDA